MRAFLLLICCCSVAAKSNLDASSSSVFVGSDTRATRDHDFDFASSTALHLSGGASERVASKAHRVAAAHKRSLPECENSSLADTAVRCTFVSPPRSCQQGVERNDRSHYAYSILKDRQRHERKFSNDAGPCRSFDDLDYQGKNFAFMDESVKNDSDPSLTASHLQQRQNTKALIFMSLLALQFGMQPILVRKFTPQGICKSSVVLTQEAIKFAISAAVYFGGTRKEQRQEDMAGWSTKSWLSVAAIPAALYTIQNIASLLAYQNLEALTFNVLNQTKILSAAVCCYFVMGKKQSKVQALSLLLLSGSALIIEKMVTLKSVRNVFGLSGVGALIASVSKVLGSLDSLNGARRFTHGVLPVLLASFISGLAGALTQKNLQGASSSSGKEASKPRNAHLFGMELNAASSIILMTSLLFSSDGRSIAERGFFHQWTPRTIIPILTNSLGGIVVGLVTKYAGSVQKGFALIFGLLLSGFIQVGHTGVSSEQIVGGLLAAMSLWLHSTHPYKGKQASL